jgi:predicted metal-dependent enzyme (double-stranded beta helix superfamily)
MAHGDANLTRSRELFASLRQLLENALFSHIASSRGHGGILGSRSAQTAFAELARPLISSWVLANGPTINRELGGAISIPEGTDEYRRNGIFFPWESHIGIFAHVWAPGGKTPIHQHEGLLALVCPLDWGIHETKFGLILSESDDHRHLENSVRKLEVLSAQSVPFAAVSSSPRGRGSIHLVRNESTEPRIVLEVYVYEQPPNSYSPDRREEAPLYRINTFLPIHGRLGDYWVKRQRAQDLPRRIDSAMSMAIDSALSGDQVLDELGDPSAVPGSVMTMGGETFVTREDMRTFCDVYHPRFARVAPTADTPQPTFAFIAS